MEKIAAPRNGEIMSLQYGRGLAALLVCLFHSYGFTDGYFGAVTPGKLFHFGHSGVEFFFLLSGFIIFIAHQRDIGHPSQLRTFVLKRMIRILPMFWLVVIPLGLVFLAVPSFGEDRALTVPKFLADLLLIPREGTLTLSPAWTLQHEVIFYLFFALLLVHRLLGIIMIAAWQAVCLVVLLFQLTPYNYLLPINKFVGFFNFGFAVGLLVAMFYKSPAFERWRGRLKIAGVIGLVLLFCMMLGEWRMEAAFLGGAPLQHLAYFAIYALIILGMLAMDHKPRPFLDRSLGLLGGASYVLYLTHEPVTSVVIKLVFASGHGPSLGADSAYWLIIVSCVVVAIAVHLLIERPVLEWLRRRLFPARRQAPTPATQPA